MSYNEFLVAAIEKVEEGQIERARSLFRRALESSGKNRGHVLFEMGRFYFHCGDYEQAMEHFLEAYKKKYNCQQIKEIIFEAYYYPNESEIRELYEKNLSVLMNYPYKISDCFRNFERLDYLFIPVTDEKMIIFDKIQDQFTEYYHKSANVSNSVKLEPGDVVLVWNELVTLKILAIKNATFNPNRYHTMRNALYLYYETQSTFETYLQVLDLDEITKDERVVFLFGENEVRVWFDNLMYELPRMVVGRSVHVTKLVEMLNQLNSERVGNFSENKKKLDDYYTNLKKTGVLQNIKSGRTKVYIPTSRFTTALQYHARDCEIVLKELGFEVLLSIEQNDLMTYSIYQRTADLSYFFPDIIFSIDHFRKELDPKEIVHVNWIQDPLPWIMNTDAPKKMTEMDIILNALFTSKELMNYGYSLNKIIDGPIGVNERIYYKHVVTADFHEKYKADIIAFSNAGDPDKGFAEFCNQIKPLIDQNHGAEEFFYQLYRRVYKNACNGKNLYSKDQYKELIEKEMIKLKWSIEENALYQIAEMFRQSVGYRILRSVPLEWLAEKGYDLKIYGDEWVTHKKLKKFAMGRAENGEMLSKIIACSKIVIGTNQGMTTHPRVGETFLSGTMYIGPEIPKEFDYADIEVFLEKNKEVILYKDKKDLFYQVGYYLTHEKERLTVIENACRTIKRTLTHKALMKSMLIKIPEIIKIEMGGE